MLIYIGKVVLFFTISIVVIRIIGKAALAQLTPHDLTAIIFLATLAVTPLATENLGRAVVGIIIVAVLHIIFAKLALFNWLNQLLIGEPTILIKQGKIMKANLKRNHFSLIELMANLRAGGFPDIKDVQYAILEPNGAVSILPVKDAITITPRHLDLQVQYQGLPISVIVEGKIQHNNLNMIEKDEAWLQKQLQALGYTDIRHIFYAAVRDNDHSLTIDCGDGHVSRFDN